MTLPARFSPLLVPALAVPAAGAAAAPQVEFASGAAVLVGRDGGERALARGMEVAPGERVRVRTGIAQVRFDDGTIASLQPGTDLAIVSLREEGARVALAAGAMRIVATGEGEAPRMRIDTPAGSVSAVGSGVVQAKPNGATAAVGRGGEWTIENPAGSIRIRPGEPAQVTAKDRPPEPGATPPVVPPPAPRPLADGVLAAPIPATESVLHSGVRGENLDGSGQPQRLVTSGGHVYERGAGSTLLEAGRDSLIAWGRWIGPVTLSGIDAEQYDFDATDGLHYVVGSPTPVLPTSGRATYSLLGATAPTWGALGPGTGGDRGPGSFSGSMWVDFAPALATLGVDFLVSMPTGSYGLNGTTTTGSANFALQPAVTPSGGACAVSCSASVVGFFAGPAAERAGVGYRIVDVDTPGGAQVPTIQGAAAFKRN